MRRILLDQICTHKQCDRTLHRQCTVFLKYGTSHCASLLPPQQLYSCPLSTNRRNVCLTSSIKLYHVTFNGVPCFCTWLRPICVHCIIPSTWHATQPPSKNLDMAQNSEKSWELPIFGCPIKIRHRRGMVGPLGGLEKKMSTHFLRENPKWTKKGPF